MCIYPTDSADYAFLVRKIALRAYGSDRQSFTDERQVLGNRLTNVIGRNEGAKQTKRLADHARRRIARTGLKGFCGIG